MSRSCPNKNDKGKGKVTAKKEATSNLAEQHSEYDEVYINTLEFESYAAAKTKTARPATIKAHHALEGTMFINGKEARVLFDTGTIGANCYNRLPGPLVATGDDTYRCDSSSSIPSSRSCDPVW